MYDYVKRALDIALSILLLILSSPLLILLAIIVKVDSPGPIIFSQERVGKNNELFTIYKFRTMYKEAPKNMATSDFEGAELHITRVGSLLRKTSLDELPQLLNILKGEMTFVGPRPVIPAEKELLKVRDEYNVFNVRPGVTGWAQINGRDLVTNEEKAAMDGKYVENYNFIIDFKIMLRTVISVITADGFHEGTQKKRNDY